MLIAIPIDAQYNTMLLHGSIIDSQFIQDTCNIDIHIEYEIERSDGFMSTDTTDLSAPAKIHFYAEGSGADHYKWSIIHKKENTEIIVATYTIQDITYTFYESGDYLIKLEAGRLNSDCVVEVYKELSIPISALDAPNFFSPLSSPGINDEFKVTYQSIVKFRATIFNRWGVKLYQWTDPDRGWDGKYKGKYVNPGVYFYIIEATGSDGRKYVKKGDINVL